MPRRILRLALLTVTFSTALAALAYEGPASAPSNAYQFAAPPEQGVVRPRGASTRGVPVTLDTAPSAAWRALLAPGLPAEERDRRAIVAMAGEYRVSFDFLEVARFDPALKADVPYQSWGTELVVVTEERPGFVALQHILEQRMVGADGRVSDPIVVRHWRQEWRYEAPSLLAYQGANRWAPRTVPASERTGAWVQSVTQVDDSPRYAARGRWEHAGGVSTWLSDETWRPLPRREWSVRKDYDVLVGTNRHTITPSGWLQEENNVKLDSASGRRLAREYGVARYERITGYGFDEAKHYLARTEPFWAEVRAAWADTGRESFTMKAQPDQASLFLPFFEYADDIAEGKAFDAGAARSFVRRTLDERYLAPR